MMEIFIKIVITFILVGIFFGASYLIIITGRAKQNADRKFWEMTIKNKKNIVACNCDDLPEIQYCKCFFKEVKKQNK